MTCPYITGVLGDYHCAQTDKKRCLKSWKKSKLRLTPHCFSLHGVKPAQGGVTTYNGYAMKENLNWE